MALYQGSTNIAGGAVIEDVVDLTSDQTINGTKTLYSDSLVKYYMQSGKGAYAGTDVPSSNQWLANLYCLDSEGTMVSSFESWADKDGYNRTMVGVAKNGLFGSIYVKINADGDKITYSPASDANNSILTTTAISKAENGYVKMGNGIILQWGYSSSSTTDPRTINFNIPINVLGSLTFGDSNLTVGTINSRLCKIIEVSSTYFKTVGVYQNVQNTDYSFYWFAIGY